MPRISCGRTCSGTAASASASSTVPSWRELRAVSERLGDASVLDQKRADGLPRGDPRAALCRAVSRPLFQQPAEGRRVAALVGQPRGAARRPRVARAVFLRHRRRIERRRGRRPPRRLRPAAGARRLFRPHAGAAGGAAYPDRFRRHAAERRDLARGAPGGARRVRRLSGRLRGALSEFPRRRPADAGWDDGWFGDEFAHLNPAGAALFSARFGDCLRARLGEASADGCAAFDQPRLHDAPPSTQNAAQWGWFNATAPDASASVAPISKRGS